MDADTKIKKWEKLPHLLAGYALFQIFAGTGLTNYLVDFQTQGISDLQEKKDLAALSGGFIAVICFVAGFYFSRFLFRHFEKEQSSHIKAIKSGLIAIYVVIAIVGSIFTQQTIYSGSENVGQDKTSENLAFEDDQNNFSFSYPASWEVKEPIMGMKALVQSKKFASNCNVRSNYHPELIDAPSITDAYGADGVQILSAGIRQISDDVSVVDEGQIQINGLPALFADTEYAVQAGNFRTMIASVLSKGTLYTIGCTDTKEHFEAALPEFRTIIDTFSF